MIGISVPNNQRQHRTLHIQKDVLPYDEDGDSPYGEDGARVGPTALLAPAHRKRAPRRGAVPAAGVTVLLERTLLPLLRGGPTVHHHYRALLLTGSVYQAHAHRKRAPDRGAVPR